jgi:hypothetical protein
MKAHLIISEKGSNNNEKVIFELTRLLDKGCKNYSDEVQLYKNYDGIDIFTEITEDKSKVKLFYDFPSDLINLEDFGSSTNLVFVNNPIDTLWDISSKFKIIHLPKFFERRGIISLSKYLYYGICREFVSQQDMDIVSKNNLPEYYAEKQKKEAHFLSLSFNLLKV